MDLALDPGFGRLTRPFVHGLLAGVALGILTALLLWASPPQRVADTHLPSLLSHADVPVHVALLQR